MLNTVRQRGFNLIEAMVAVSVLGILLAATVPSMTDWIRATRVRGLAETTQAGLQKARNEAMKRNKVVTLWLVDPPNTTQPTDACTLSSSSGAWVISLDDPTSHCGSAPSSTAAPRIVEVYGPGKGGDQVVFTAVDKDANAATSVSFNGFGQRVGGGIATINISHSAGASVRPLRITISSSGGIRSCDPTVSTPDPRACS